MPRTKVLLVGTYTRIDYLKQLKKSLDDIDFLFLEYISPTEETNKYYTDYGKAIYWSNYKNAFDLLEQIKPTKVLFIFIEAYNHVALNAVCNIKGIPTYIIDHGILDININFRLKKYFSKQPNPKKLIHKILFLFLLRRRFKSRLFLTSTIRLLPTYLKKDVIKFVHIRSKYNFWEAINLSNFTSRLPSAYISYSKKNFEFHVKNDHLAENAVAHFIGMPLFDNLAKLKITPSPQKNIIFIDQALAKQNILGWTQVYHSNFTKHFASLCSLHGFKLFIKLHPLQSNREKEHWLQDDRAIIVDEKDIEDLLPNCTIIIGFFSTYLLPLAALEHTTLITLENHPVGKLDVSKSFIDAGVAHPIYDLEELDWALQNIEQLHQKQLPNKKQFEQDWLYKFDGKAGERLRDILLSNDL